MKPYHERDGIAIYCGDAREVVPTLPEGSIDCVLTDPPYGSTSLTWDTWVFGWPRFMMPILRRHGSMWVFGSQRMFLHHLAEFDDWVFVQDLVWEKHNGTGLFNDRFRRVHELVLQFRPPGQRWADVYKEPQMTLDATKRVIRKKAMPAHWTGPTGSTVYRSDDGGPRLMRSVIYARSRHGKALHPTEKPLPVVEPLVRYSCPPDGVVLDPFMGSGSTLLAARRLRRRAVGVEISERYCETAAIRLSQGE